MGHARALLALDGELQIGTARKVAAKGLSVRETEQLVNGILQPRAKTARPKGRSSRDIQRLEEEVSEKLGTSVEIKPTGKKGSGKLVISYISHEHLDTLLARQWLIEREEPGAFVVRHEKEDKHSATVRLEYDASEIRIAYVASENLDCTPEGESCREINRAYNRWVEQLERDITIRVNHAAFRGVAAPAPAPG